MGPTRLPSAAPSSGGGVREARRRETRARLFEAALAEMTQHGLAAADVSAIATAAGVARGTFYFHFPTKEHVLIEVERNEEIRIVGELADAVGDLWSVLSQLVHQILRAKSRLGATVFRDMLGLHFSSARPIEDELAQHPLAEFLVDVITQAQNARQVPQELNAEELGTFFLTGLFALLATGAHDPELLDRYVSTIVKGMEMR
ncbi:TetR/AcrR family transcriptional regulator [[Mycobacterium] nativiensis]|uniref:Helix-turn-helix domain-containing protein n=1 Tax=[Mycobacterium] nativiensis TaxID=2855503 RepID=A0ABU5XUG9_9MYCO|nr:TetR/AcrR family transcriptional regulator [Mycolicibacter sp. MYC340]MEB3031620.1 helix-turn-helix domain-containing protein [Mycolicibacter sp. MYC340]